MIGSVWLTVHVGEKAVLSVTNELFAHLLVSSSEWKEITASKHLDTELKGSDQDQNSSALKDHRQPRVGSWAAVPSNPQKVAQGQPHQGIRFRTQGASRRCVSFSQVLEGLALCTYRSFRERVVILFMMNLYRQSCPATRVRWRTRQHLSLVWTYTLCGVQSAH